MIFEDFEKTWKDCNIKEDNTLDSRLHKTIAELFYISGFRDGEKKAKKEIKESIHI